MCGRYRIKDTGELAAHARSMFDISEGVPAEARYNIAPSQECPIFTMDEEGDVVVPSSMRWGFVPFWDKSEKPRLAPINAQAENIATSGLFRQAVRRRRCLVPADGFYEWLRLDEKTKVPFDIRLKDGRSFFMAGVYEKPAGTRPATFAILTTTPNALMAKIHTRMPVILDDDAARQWLRRGDLTPEALAACTAPHPAEKMEATPISGLVNNPRNDLPEVLEPVAFAPPPQPAPRPIQGELF